MILVRTIMNVLPEKQKEVLQTLLALHEQPDKASGCQSYGIFCDIEDKNIFSLISEWRTREDLDRHVRSERFSVLLGTRSLLSTPMEMKIHTVSGSEGMETFNTLRGKKTFKQNF